MKQFLLQQQCPTIKAQLSIQSALQFVGDNHQYQKKRLFLLTGVILGIAILTCRISTQGPTVTTLYLVSSGIGQIICPIYMSIRTIILGLTGFAMLGMAFYPVNQYLNNFAQLGIGFFGRGFYVSSFIYLNQIGGQKFRALSIIVIFGAWGISSLSQPLSVMLVNEHLQWVFYYGFIMIPIILDSYFILQNWEESPFRLYMKKQFNVAERVLNTMAAQNQRPFLPYQLEVMPQTQKMIYKKPTYLDIITRPYIRKMTIPLLLVWIYRQYIYYSCYLILPQIGQNTSKNFLILSIGQIISVLLSYPVKLYVKRVHALFFCTIGIAIFSLMSSFTTIDTICFSQQNRCAAKYIYQISIFVIRSSSALIGAILISYTLEVYPSNVRSMGFNLCFGVSSIGSIFIPWINSVFIYADLSGFISFFVISMTILYFINKLKQTYGKIKVETLEQLQNIGKQISLRNWASLNF